MASLTSYTSAGHNRDYIKYFIGLCNIPLNKAAIWHGTKPSEYKWKKQTEYKERCQEVALRWIRNQKLRCQVHIGFKPNQHRAYAI